METVYIGVDIGGTNIRVACSDVSGNFIMADYTATWPLQNTEPFDDRVIGLIDGVVRQAAEKGYHTGGIGLGIPGTYSRGEIIMSPNIQDMHASEIIGFFDQKGIPLFIMNDVKCAAMGEQWKGTAKDLDDFLFLNIGTGISIAAVIGGKVHLGHNGAAGEIGYWLSDVGATTGYRQGRAPLEEKISGRWLSERVNRFHSQREITETSVDRKNITTKEIFEQYKKGDTAIRAVVDDGIQYLGTALADICILLDPAMIVFGGGVSRDFSCFSGYLQDYLSQTVPFPPKIVRSVLGDDAGIYGAVRLAIQST